MTMQEFERGKFRTDLFPKAPDAEISLSRICIVEQNDRPVGQLVAPTLEVMLHGFISVEAVNVKEVHSCI
jgi:hypothetical protein